ncbi:hypothetical protein ACFLW6_04470 [Chloroflexota bacterium]
MWDKCGAYVECIQCGAVLNVPEMISRDTKAKREHQERKALVVK